MIVTRYSNGSSGYIWREIEWAKQYLNHTKNGI